MILVYFMQEVTKPYNYKPTHLYKQASAISYELLS